MSASAPASNRSPGFRWLLLGLLVVAAVQSVLLWMTSPEDPPPPIDGVEVVLTSENFQQEVLDHDGYVLVDFWFEACPPCRRMKPVIAHLSLDYQDRVKVGKVDIDEHVDLPMRYGLQAFPTLLLFRDGEVVARWEGYGGLKEMSRWLDQQLAAAPRPVSGATGGLAKGVRHVAGND
jgi:thioredoxin 1